MLLFQTPQILSLLARLWSELLSIFQWSVGVRVLLVELKQKNIKNFLALKIDNLEDYDYGFKKKVLVVNWDICLKLKPLSNNLTNSVVAEVEVLNVKNGRISFFVLTAVAKRIRLPFMSTLTKYNVPLFKGRY